MTTETRRHGTRLCLALGALALASACRRAEPPPDDASVNAQGYTAASAATRAANEAVARELPLSDEQDFSDAKRGLVASDPDVVIQAANGASVWTTREYGFVSGDPPASVFRNSG